MVVDVGERLEKLRGDLEARRFTRELIDVPIDLARAGDLPSLQREATLLLAALHARAEELSTFSIGPLHHDVARALSALESAGVDLGPVLGLVRKMWSPPRPRPAG